MKQMKHQGRRGLEGRSGFTLIEVLLVMVIFSTVATIIVPSIVSAQKKLRIDAAVQQVRIDLARARAEAMTRNQVVTVKRTSTNAYTVPFLGERDLEGATFRSGSADSIKFTSYGSLTPVATRTMVLELSGQTRTVSVSPAGFTSVR